MSVRATIVPGFFTMANMFCGFYSTILSTTAYAAAEGQPRFITAAWLIIAAAVLDALDGKLARFTDSTSDFGIQYDSMADVISFGLAPSVMAYFVFFNAWGTLGLLASFTPLVFGSIRLARFNVIQSKSTQKSFFTGLPIPVAAITICTFVLFNFEIWGTLRWSKLYFSLILITSLLMISNFRYEIMPNFSLHSGKANSIKILVILVGIVLIILYPHSIFFPLSLGYILSGPARYFFDNLRGNNNPGPPTEDQST